jgi:hypothetical protein
MLILVVVACLAQQSYLCAKQGPAQSIESS